MKSDNIHNQNINNYNQINNYNNPTPSSNYTINDDLNYQTLITKLSKGTIQQKYISIKKLLFLYQNARSRVYLYQRRIVQSLQLSLLIQQNQVSLNALNLLQKILISSSTQSQIGNIFRKKLVSKVIINLGSAQINIRKVSHKCINQYIKKFKDYQTIITAYLKTSLKSPHQHNTKHLKLKSINSLHSLLMSQQESKYFQHSTEYSLALIQELIYLSYQKEFIEIRRAAIVCLICVLKLHGSQNTLMGISNKAQGELYQLSLENQELHALIAMIMKQQIGKMEKGQQSQQNQQSDYTSQNAPSPKFISIQQSQVLINKPTQRTNLFLPSSIPSLQPSLSPNQTQHQSSFLIDNIPQSQLKIFNQVSYAQQFLKKLQKSTSFSLSEIKNFAPYLQKYLVDQSIKLFSISKKIVEVIFDSTTQGPSQVNSSSRQGCGGIEKQHNSQHKQYYVVIVPCVVKGIGNSRFIVRKNLDKLVRTYAKNYTQIWLNNFIQRFSKTNNTKLKQILLDLFMYSYKISPQFFYPVQKSFQIFDQEIISKNSNLKWKVIDCVILMIERQAIGQHQQHTLKDKEQSNESQRTNAIEEMLNMFSQQSYNKILRKLNKNIITIQVNSNNSIQKSNQGLNENNKNNISAILQIEVPSPVSVFKRKVRRNRLVTDQPQKMLSIQKDQDTTQRNNVSQDKSMNLNLNKGLFFKDKQKQKKTRKSIIEYDLKLRRKTQKRQQSKQRSSLEKLPELRVKNQGPHSKQGQHNSLSKYEVINAESPVKKSFTEKNINYLQKEQLQKLDDPKAQLQRALVSLKSNHPNCVNSSNSNSISSNPNSNNTNNNNWMIQFDSINKIRSIVQHNPNIITQQILSHITNQLLNCLNIMKSGVMKISLICLDQVILKFKKKMYHFTEAILTTIIKKSIGTSQFIADQLKKCIIICSQQLCPNRIIPTLTQIIKQTKNTQIKLNILLIIQTLIRCQKLYKSNIQFIWYTLIQFHDQPQYQLRLQCKNLIKLILQIYKSSWKQDVIQFKKAVLEKIDKILKNINININSQKQKGQQSSWLQLQGQQFQKIIFSKGISVKYFNQQYSKFQELDKLYLAKKNFKSRIKLVTDTFNIAFEYPIQFENNINVKKYLTILIQHIDQKNPGMLINAINVLGKVVDVFGSILEQFLGVILQKYLNVLELRKNQLISTYHKFIHLKLYKKYDINKIIKQYIKLMTTSSTGISNNIRIKCQIINQVLLILKQQQQYSSLPLYSQSVKRQDRTYSQKQKQRDYNRLQKLKNKQNTLVKDLVTIQTPTSLVNISSTINKITYTSSASTGQYTPSSSSVNIIQSGLVNTLTINSETNIPSSSNNLSKDSIQIKRSNANNPNAIKLYGNISQTSLNLIIKMVNKFLNDKECSNNSVFVGKLKDLIGYCNKKYGHVEFSSKINLSQKVLADFVE